MTNLDILSCKRVKMGWFPLQRVIEHLGNTNKKITLIYSFEYGELIITDDSILEILSFLSIDYEVINPHNSIKFIKEAS